nr:hypothetical protein [Tanacetum cinerariifolium]GEZ75969.1 hypothetical protein [Tanacetum cinerariifolium]
MGNVKKSVAERTRHQRQYDRRVNKRQIQMQESKIDTGKAVDVGLVVTKSSRIESEVQDNSSLSGNDTNADDVDIRPIYDEEPMVEEVNSRAKIQSHKTINRNKLVDQKSRTQIPGRHIFIGHRFSPNKTFAVYEKPSPRSDLRWKPIGRIFKYVGLKWIPTGKLFDSCTSKVDSEPTHGSNVDIPNIHESKQTLDLSIELESIFGPLFDEYFNGENQGVSKFFDVTTTDAFDKRQQQPDSTSSTLTLATYVTADGNFDL